MLPQIGHQLLHALANEQFSRIGRNRTAGDQKIIFHAGRHDDIFYFRFPDQVIGHTNRWDTVHEIFCQLGLAQVESERNSTLPRQGERSAEVGSHKGFTFPAYPGSNEDAQLFFAGGDKL